MYEIMPFGRRNGIARTYNPFALMDELEKSFLGTDHTPHTSLSFKTDIKDTGDSYELKADLPGFAKEDIHVDIEDDVLTIAAERKSESEEKDESGNYIRRERSYGSYSRSFDISNIESDGITVAYTDGVLTLTLPKLADEQPKVRHLTIA